MLLFLWPGSPPSCCLLCALVSFFAACGGVSSLGPAGLSPRAPWLDCGNCTRLQVVEQLMGRSQGPAVTEGKLFFSLFLIVVALARRRRWRPRGGQPRGCGIHAHSPTHSHTRPHTLARTHTHPIVMRGGKGASWLVGTGVWHGFEVFLAIGRFGGREG